MGLTWNAEEGLRVVFFAAKMLSLQLRE